MKTFYMINILDLQRCIINTTTQSKMNNVNLSTNLKKNVNFSNYLKLHLAYLPNFFPFEPEY